MTQTLLLVDRNARNLQLLTQTLGTIGLNACSASSYEEIEQMLETCGPIALALVDVSGFDRNVWEYCKQLHQVGIPLLVIAPNLLMQQESLLYGARGTLVKPLKIKEFLELVRSLIKDSEG